MAASSIPTPAKRRCGTAVQKGLAERDALVAEVAARDTRAAVREAHRAWLAAGSEAEGRAGAAWP